MNKKSIFFIVVALFAITSCVTVNIYFPASAVQKAADLIVEDIRGVEKGQDKPKEKKPDKESSLINSPRFSFGPTVALAQIDIEVSTPAIRALKESLKGRFPQLKPFYDGGVIGENNKGLIEVRDSSGLNLKQKAELNKLVEQENKDREALYTDILKANKFGKEFLPEIQKIFANSWREKSLENWWIQNDKGEWVRKK